MAVNVTFKGAVFPVQELEDEIGTLPGAVTGDIEITYTVPLEPEQVEEATRFLAGYNLRVVTP